MDTFARLTCLLALFSLAAQANERPRLGVFIVIDQLSAEVFRARLGQTAAGLKRLTTEGLVFHELRFDSAPSLTSPGHATLVTGAWPETHGVVANEWFDGETGRPRGSTEDPAYLVLGREPGKRDGTAPTWLRVPTLADATRGANDAAKAVSISTKDRSAILTAGHAGLALWVDAERGLFTTSTAYAKEVPAWVTPVNERLMKFALSGALKVGLPGGGTTGKAPLPPKPHAGDGEPFAERSENQAMMDTAEVDLALAAVKALELGRDDVPNLLTISFSGHDLVGHEFGPDSPQALEEFLHVDRELGRLLDALDAQVGKGRYVVALSADHGVAPVPELAKARGLDAGRLDLKALGVLIDAELDAALGPATWLVGYKSPGFEVDPKLRQKVPAAFERVRAAAMKHPGVADLLWGPALAAGATTSAAALYRNGFFPGRSADLIVVVKPFWVSGPAGQTTHGSPYLYDRAVPLVLFGAGVKKGRLPDAEAADVAPTFSRLLGIPPPAAARGHAIEAVFQ